MCEYNHPEFGWIPYTANKDHIELKGEELQKEIWDEIQKTDKSKVKDNIEIPKERLIFDLEDLLTKEINELESKYTEKERSLWDRKRIEAEKVIAGQESAILNAESKLSGEDVKKLAEKIIKKNDDYNIAVINSRALREKYIQKIKEIKNRAEYEKIRKEIEKISEIK